MTVVEHDYRDEVARRLKQHRCAGATENGYRVFFNDWGVQIPGLPGVTVGCPFCWRDYLSMRDRWNELWFMLRRVATPEEVVPVVVDAVRRLERPNPPPNSILNPFGVGVSVRGLSIHISTNGLEDRARYQITMYQRCHRRRAELHRARAEAVTTALTTSIRESWNGGDGDDGISIVLNRLAPDGLLVPLRNYRAIAARCFNPIDADRDDYAAFRAWYEAPFELS